MSPRIKYILAQERKAMFPLMKKLLSFTQFSNLFHNADNLLYYPQMSLFSFHTFFVFEHPKNAQFDIYAISSNLTNKF